MALSGTRDNPTRPSVATVHLPRHGLAVRLLEAGSGEVVVLLHGVGMRAEAWRPQLSALADTRRVIAADLPGHGASDPLPGCPRLEDYVRWAGGLIEALSAAPVALAGHSMGALIAAGLAIERPELVSRVALLNGVYRRSPEAQQAVRTRAERIAAGANGVADTLERWFGATGSALRGEVANWLQTTPHAGYLAAYDAFAGGDGVYADRLGEIRVPLLALTAAEDPHSTPGMSRAMAAMAPHGRAVVIDGHRHLVNLTASAAVTAELTHWLATGGLATGGLATGASPGM